MNKLESGIFVRNSTLAAYRALWAMMTIVALSLGLVSPAFAGSSNEDVQTAWRLLDYVAVDYRGAVANGQIKNRQEYAEMTEFSSTIETKITGLAASVDRTSLIAEAKAFRGLVGAKAEPDDVARAARALGTHLLAVYPVPLAPAKAPDLARGAALYTQNCAGCHGVRGDGHGPDAAKLDPAPVAFRDADRARERSPFALYQVIGQPSLFLARNSNMASP